MAAICKIKGTCRPVTAPSHRINTLLCIQPWIFTKQLEVTRRLHRSPPLTRLRSPNRITQILSRYFSIRDGIVLRCVRIRFPEGPVPEADIHLDDKMEVGATPQWRGSKHLRPDLPCARFVGNCCVRGWRQQGWMARCGRWGRLGVGIGRAASNIYLFSTEQFCNRRVFATIQTDRPPVILVKWGTNYRWRK